MRLAGLPWPHVAGRVFAGQQRRAQDSGSESQESDDEEHHPGATVETIMRDLADLNPQLDITPILCMIGRGRRTDVCGEGGGGGGGARLLLNPRSGMCVAGTRHCLHRLHPLSTTTSHPP